MVLICLCRREKGAWWCRRKPPPPHPPREIRLHARLQHTNIIQFYAAFLVGFWGKEGWWGEAEGARTRVLG